MGVFLCPEVVLPHFVFLLFCCFGSWSVFISFLLFGFIPLLVYVLDYLKLMSTDSPLFLYSSILTGLVFMLIGYLKAIVTQTKVIRSMLETFFLGAAAAGLAYLVGDVLEGLFS